MRGLWKKTLNGLTEQPPWLFRQIFPGSLFRVGTADRRVYLTFDDGPIPEATPEILEILKCHNVCATFFMVGDNIRKYPEIAEAVRRDGHSIGSHTFSHLQGLKTATGLFLEDVAKGAAAAGDTPLFRPPHGLLKPAQWHRLKRQGYRIVFFDVVSRDYDSEVTAEELERIVMKRIRPGSIVVFHDSIRTISKLRVALHPLIERIRREGYEFDTLKWE